MKKYPFLLKFAVVICLLALLLALPGAAASAQPSDPAELETFLDSFFPELLETAGAPGAVVVVVKDGEIFLAKGYGLADVTRGTPMDPEQTILRAGSISKLFTATAVMQLAEQGRLDLNAPVNQYLETFQLDDNFPAPVTLAQLLTHTGGFDEKAAGMAVSTPVEITPLGAYLAANMPPRITPPGDQINYSNHGFALAGYLVEAVSGRPFAQYAAENIFQPLGMSRSSFAEPPPAQLADEMAAGYAYVNGTYQPLPPDYFNTPPASSLYTTGADMARFMLAHLQDGQYEGARILEPASAQEMRQRQFSHHPRLRGWAYAFFEREANGRPAVAHGGDVPGFSSLLFLLPEENLGIFVGLNASVNLFGGGADPRQELVDRFLDRYYPAPEPAAPPAAMPAADLSRFTGSYRWNHYAHTSLEKGLPPIPLLQFQVTAGEDGALTLTPPPGMGETSRWIPVEPLLFRSPDKEEYIAFREDENGQITDLFFTLLEMPAAAEKAAWYDTAVFQAALAGFFLVLFLSALLWPAAGLARRWRKRPAMAGQGARGLAAAVAGLNLVFFIGLVGRMGQLSANVFAPIPGWFTGLLAIPLLTAALTAWLAWLAARAWRDRQYSLAGRIHYSLLVLAALAFVWFVNYWNLLGWQF